MSIKISEPTVHFIIWLIVSTVVFFMKPLHMQPLTYGDGSMLIILGLGTAINIGIFYLTAFRWLPLWQKQGWRAQSLLEPVAVLVVGVAIKFGVLAGVIAWFYPGSKLPEDVLPLLPIMSGFMSSMFIVFGANYRLVRDRIEYERVRKELEHRRTLSELAFLKTQVNPHFLFNTLNNLYGLATREGAEATGDAILKLADMMRYMLHETGEDFLPLDQEIDCLKNYVELQKLRIPKGRDVIVDFKIEGQVELERTPPMMLIPLVENAFKYGISFKNPSEILMSLKVEEEGVRFRVENTVHHKEHNLEHQPGGIGLENLERRLGLIYPNGQHFRYGEENGRFTAELFFPRTI